MHVATHDLGCDMHVATEQATSAQFMPFFPNILEWDPAGVNSIVFAKIVVLQKNSIFDFQGCNMHVETFHLYGFDMHVETFQ